MLCRRLIWCNRIYKFFGATFLLIRPAGINISPISFAFHSQFTSRSFSCYISTPGALLLLKSDYKPLKYCLSSWQEWFCWLGLFLQPDLKFFNFGHQGALVMLLSDSSISVAPFVSYFSQLECCHYFWLFLQLIVTFASFCHQRAIVVVVVVNESYLTDVITCYLMLSDA